MIFASGLILDREPMQWVQLPAAVIEWVQTAGAFAALGLLLWALFRVVQRQRPFGRSRLAPVLEAVAVLSWLGFGAILLAYLGSLLHLSFVAPLVPLGGLPYVYQFGARAPWNAGDVVYTVSAVLALAIVLAPPLADSVTRLRWGRIWALARLSLKEAIRNRAVLVFAAMALIFLFADWFVDTKAKDQVRTYVRLVFWSISPLFLLTAGMLGAFSIPADVKSQSIQTIVTKPVEKFEVVLGRFLGYAILLTVGLAVLSGLSLLYVIQGINPDAARESYKARVPLFGQLGFYGTKNAGRGDSVGREWDYRSYIMGPRTGQKELAPQLAVWSFPTVPAALGEGGATEDWQTLARELDDPDLAATAVVGQTGHPRWVKFEYTFDIYRLSKGVENTDIPCTFTLADGRLAVPEVLALAEKVKQEHRDLERKARAEHDAQLRQAATAKERDDAAEAYRVELAKARLGLVTKYRFYQLAGVPVTDYHTQALMVPRALFKALSEQAAEAPATDGPPPPALQVLVNVDRLDESQMLGVAQRDLYLLAAERPFWQNFLKGMVGLWCSIILVLGVAIALSAYLSGVISWLCTMFLYGAGVFAKYVGEIASGQLYGGGASEASYRLLVNRPISAPIDATPAADLIRAADQVSAWWVRRFVSLIPDVNRYDLHPYVASGFDISVTNVLLVDNVLPLIGYLLPWAVLAYYLMKYREIANPT